MRSLHCLTAAALLLLVAASTASAATSGLVSVAYCNNAVCAPGSCEVAKVIPSGTCFQDDSNQWTMLTCAKNQSDHVRFIDEVIFQNVPPRKCPESLGVAMQIPCNMCFDGPTGQGTNNKAILKGCEMFWPYLNFSFHCNHDCTVCADELHVAPEECGSDARINPDISFRIRGTYRAPVLTVQRFQDSKCSVPQQGSAATVPADVTKCSGQPGGNNRGRIYQCL